MCTLGAYPAITVTVRDAATTAPAALGAAGIAQSGVFLDTMELIGVPYDSSQAELLATRRAGSGVYSVVVSKPGYAQWRVDGVRVDSGDCGPVPVSLQANLTRSP
jgi:hypothetical protein